MAVDQLTKQWALDALANGPINLIGETLRFRLTRNPGAAFSSFTGGGAVLAGVAIVAVVAIALYLPKVELALDRLALALIMGGAAGNVVDRIFRGDGFLDGAVIDFIDLSFWPTFNVADSAISIGVVVMVFSAFFIAPRAQRVEAAPAVPDKHP